jgi:adenylate cyclase
MGFSQNKLRENGLGEGGDGGVAAVQKALALDSDLADAHALHARHLWQLNLVEEALAEVETALQLDPESWAVNMVAAQINYGLRRFETAIVYWEKAVASPESASGDAGMLMSTYHAVGDEEGAMRAAQIVLERAERALARDDVDAFARCCGMSALAALGHEARARDLIERGLLLDPDNIKMRYNFACGLVTYLHDHEGALDVLAPVFPRFNAKWVRHARADPDFDPLRGNSRFQAMMAEAEARVRQAGEID